MSNGDVLPGRLVWGMESSDIAAQLKSVSVSAADPLSVRAPRQPLIQVRRRSLARISLTDGNPNLYAPGLVMFRDGRKLTARAIRWDAHGIRLLLGGSTVTAEWSEVADVHLPQVDRRHAMLHDALLEPLESPSVLGRMVSANGSRVDVSPEPLSCG